MVSDGALMGRLQAFRSLVKCGTKPHRSESRLRSPVAGLWRTTIAACVGATFQEGAVLGSSPAVRNRRAMNSGGSWEAKRPYIGINHCGIGERPQAARIYLARAGPARPAAR